ncbi:hypothetical protein [Pseudofrankia sp. BMG5.37]|uniref:hypothetical protein n=1 Tax=Pseudofrankia sp. BMG5.37 TaxID=3050035 RepID=UPI0028955FA5|nr:hypothetical protein [Pseudofrankia sp. BMG5.37]MDT3446872.1 hypothetical protein [Pseudofrankia sp. BMG5.37]
MAGPVATAAEMVAGHVSLDISCLDRIYLNGYVPSLQTQGGVIWFFAEHRGKPIVSPALFEPMGNKFRRDLRQWADANTIPMIRFAAGDRKADVMAPYLAAAEQDGQSQVAAIGTAQEYQLVWTARRRDTDPAKGPQFSFTKEQRRVTVFYVYLFDADMGPGFIKICSYFPYPIKAWVNGHEYAKRQAAKAGIGFTALSNGFASCDDPAALQEVCDRLQPGTIQLWFERWMSQIPLPLTDTDRDAGVWWELSMRQVEVSRTLVFDADVHARAFFEALLTDNMDLGRPENVELLFRRGQRLGRPTLPPYFSGFKTAIDRLCDLVTLNVFYRHSRLKQYLKNGAALRIETVINDPHDLRCNRRLTNLPELREKARTVNDYLLATETAPQDTTLVSPVLERITRPSLTDEGRKAPALRFGDLRVQALAGTLAALLFTVTGITNRGLRAQMTGLLHRPYSMNQASYDLTRLVRNGLIDKIPGRNSYTVTDDGLLFAHLYVKIYDHLLRPLMAPDRPNAPPELTDALDTLRRLVANQAAHARLPVAT